jgi:hypothetical protein
MEKNELKSMMDNMHAVADQVPRGLSGVSDAITFALLDLTTFQRYGTKTKDFDKALEFGKSIPITTDYESDEFNSWLINDREHLKYWS